MRFQTRLVAFSQLREFLKLPLSEKVKKVLADSESYVELGIDPFIKSYLKPETEINLSNHQDLEEFIHTFPHYQYIEGVLFTRQAMTKEEKDFLISFFPDQKLEIQKAYRRSRTSYLDLMKGNQAKQDLAQEYTAQQNNLFKIKNRNKYQKGSSVSLGYISEVTPQAKAAVNLPTKKPKPDVFSLKKYEQLVDEINLPVKDPLVLDPDVFKKTEALLKTKIIFERLLRDHDLTTAYLCLVRLFSLIIDYQMCVTKSFASFDDTQRTALLESLKDLDSFLNENKKNIISYLRASQNIRLEPVFPAEIYLNVNSKTKTTPAMAELIYDFTVLKIWEIMSVYFLSSDDQEIKHEGLEILVGIEQKVHKQIIHNKALNFLHGAFHSAQLGYMPLEIKLFLNKIFEEDEN